MYLENEKAETDPFLDIKGLGKISIFSKQKKKPEIFILVLFRRWNKLKRYIQINMSIEIRHLKIVILFGVFFC